MTRHPVTDHAVYRYFERIHGMTHLADRFWRDPDQAAAGAAILGLTVDEARDLVCPPRLHVGVSIGTGLVKAGDRVLRIVDGRVVTCMRPEPRRRQRQPHSGRVAACAA